MKAVVVGTGAQGVPLAYSLNRLGFDVFLSDRSTHNYNEAIKKLKTVGIDAQGSSDFSELLDGADVVVSAASFFANQEIARKSLSAGVRYCDLGGDPTTSHAIADMGKELGITVFTDLGLAPGLINILAEELIRRNEEAVTDVKIMVGGLPVNPTGLLKYARTWSVEGLRNEYSGRCEVLRDGKLCFSDALTEVEEVEFEGMPRMEAFHTKGGLASSFDSLKSKGVINAEYKTMRFAGHAELISFLMNDCGLTNEEFDKAITNATSETREDQVLMMASINGNYNGWKVMHDEHWSAMQKATAFPAAACAALVASGTFDDVVVPTYGDIPFELMQENLNKIGGFPQLL